MGEAGQNVLLMPFDGAGHRNHRLQHSVHGRELPFLPKVARCCKAPESFVHGQRTDHALVRMRGVAGVAGHR